MELRIAGNGVVADLANDTLRDRTGAQIPLRPQAFAVLRCLAERPGQLVTKDEIMAAVWPGVAVTDDSLVQAVGDIRRAIGDEAHAILRTVPRRGYRLVPPEDGAALPARSAPRWAAVAAAVLLAIGAAGAWWQFGRTERIGVSLDGPPLVAVLQLINVAGDEASARLAQGLKKDFYTELSRFREFQIVLRSSSYFYESDLADGLDVDLVLAGAIHREGDRLRITAQLLEARTGNLIWSERWDRPDDDVFAIQTEIAQLISNRLGGGAGLIHEVGRIAAHRKRPADLTAYELYLLGTEKLERMGRAEVEEAVRLLDRSVALDPEFARGWVELSLGHDALADLGVEPERNRQAAAEAAERAVGLNPSDAKAHAALGLSARHRNDFARARSGYDTALSLAPNAWETLALAAGWAPTAGEAGRGAEMADRVVRQSPGVPAWSARQFAHAYFMAGRYEDALAMTDRVPADGYTLLIWTIRPAALAVVGRMQEARDWAEKAVAARPDLSIETMANQPGYSAAERRRFVETMRLAGFPPCAPPEVLAGLAKPARLPTCAAHADAAAR
jgi:TolB-like protein/DNA-binding winged helix-turn-helix (wHTH) protein